MTRGAARGHCTRDRPVRTWFDKTIGRRGTRLEYPAAPTAVPRRRDDSWSAPNPSGRAFAQGAPVANPNETRVRAPRLAEPQTQPDRSGWMLRRACFLAHRGALARLAP